MDITLSVMMVTTAGFAFSATSAKALLNCRTTEFCAINDPTTRSDTIIFFMRLILFYVSLEMRNYVFGSQKTKSPVLINEQGFLLQKIISILF